MPFQNRPRLSAENIVLGIFILLTIGVILFYIIVIEDNTLNLPIIQHQDPTSFSLPRTNRTGSGNELTGEVTAALFVLSIISILITKIIRIISQTINFTQSGQATFEIIERLSTKYLKPFHSVLSFCGIAFGVFHLILSNCQNNPIPEIGLLFAAVIMINGLLVRLKNVSPDIRQNLNKFHQNWIITGVLFAILLAGHLVMDLD